MNRLNKIAETIAGFAFGLGLAGIIVHNPSLSPKWLVPTTGLLMLLYSMPLLLNKEMFRELTKNLLVTIPMFIIVLLVGYQIGLSGQFRLFNSQILGHGWISPFIFAIFVFGIYLIVKTHPRILELPFSIMTITSTIGIVYTAFTTGLKSGGWVTGMDYDTIVPLLIIGCLLSPRKWRVWLSGISVIGLFFSGAEIGLLCVVLLGLVISLRRDFSWKLVIPIGALVVCLLVATPLGVTHKLWIHNSVQVTLGDRVEALSQWQSGVDYKTLDRLITGNRLLSDWKIRPPTLLGYGYMAGSNPANQILIMTDQVGIITALAWLVATIVWGVKTKNYYLLVVILSVGCFDLFFWYSGLLWWWALMGIESKGLIYKNT